MTTKQIELTILEPHKADGIKELCYKEINNPDVKYSFMGSPNMTLGERRANLLEMRKQANSAMTALERESEEIVNTEKRFEKQSEHFKDRKAIVLTKLNNIMDVVSIIDKYSIEHTKEVCRKSESNMAHAIAHAMVSFPLTFEGEDVVVNCSYYEGISLNDDLMKEYLALEDEEKEIEFIKNNIEFGNITLTKKEDVEKLEKALLHGAQDIDAPQPVFANLDPVYMLDSTEVDK